MAHDCRIGNIRVIEDAFGVLYINVLTTLSDVSKDYRVDFCPVCAAPSKIKFGENFSYFSRNEKSAEADDIISKFSTQLSESINDMNHNIELIKSYMIVQNTQNDCFIERDLFASREISSIKTCLKILEEKIINLSNQVNFDKIKKET